MPRCVAVRGPCRHGAACCASRHAVDLPRSRRLLGVQAASVKRGREPSASESEKESVRPKRPPLIRSGLE